MAKMNDNFTEDAVYEDLFASCKNRDEIGESPCLALYTEG
jgi:hypothetical protein